MGKTYYDSTLTDAQIQQVLNAINNILTPSNNGKVLAISNGLLEARSVQWGGGYPEPTGTITLTENGLHNVKDYAEANVQVQGGSIEVIPLSVTANDTYTAPAGKAYSPVTVNVSGGGIVIGDNILSGPSVPTANVGVDGDIYLQVLSTGDATDYVPVEYIQATSDQYITTPLLIDQNYKISAKASFDTLRESAVFGGLWQVTGFTLRISQVSGAWRFGLMTGGGDIVAGSAEADTLYQIEAENGSLTINGTEYTGSAGSNANDRLSIFRVTSKGSASSLRPVALMKLFGFTAYSEGELVFYGVPVRNINTGDAGLYDLVTDTFYGSVTSNKFIAGPDSPTGREVIAEAYCKINGIWQKLIGTVINTGGTQ